MSLVYAALFVSKTIKKTGVGYCISLVFSSITNFDFSQHGSSCLNLQMCHPVIIAVTPLSENIAIQISNSGLITN